MGNVHGFASFQIISLSAGAMLTIGPSLGRYATGLVKKGMGMALNERTRKYHG